jgi:N-acetylglucosamine kinase-like BadF-type ATPase
VSQGLLLGLDIGGSSSRARLVEDGRIVAEAEGPGANVAALRPRVVEGRLRALLADILASPPRGEVPRSGGGETRARKLLSTPIACCAGSAGAEVPAGRERLERILSALLPDCRITVVHDARLVLAAAGLESGIALISGTGSVAYGRDGAGREARAGGWGWLVGDDGSAAWLAREAAREVMLRSDSGEPLGSLGESMLGAVKARGVTELMGRLNGFNEPREWAALAGVVFEAARNDAGAALLVERTASALGDLVGLVRKQLSMDGPLVLAGGQLLNQPLLESAVRMRLGTAIRLREQPVAGAVRLAELSLTA